MWGLPGTSVWGKLSQEEHEFEAILGKIARSCLVFWKDRGVVIETGFLCLDQAGFKLRESLVSASQLLGLKVCAITAQQDPVLNTNQQAQHIVTALMHEAETGGSL